MGRPVFVAVQNALRVPRLAGRPQTLCLQEGR